MKRRSFLAAALALPLAPRLARALPAASPIAVTAKVVSWSAKTPEEILADIQLVILRADPQYLNTKVIEFTSAEEVSRYFGVTVI